MYHGEKLNAWTHLVGAVLAAVGSIWLLVMAAFLVLVTYVPFVSLALPNWLGM